MAKAKATKKFERKHLKDTLKKRNEIAKVKQKQHARTKKKSADAADAGGAAGRPVRKPTGLANEQFAAMATDEFFEDAAVQVPKMSEKKKGKGGSKRPLAAEEEEEEEDESSEWDESDSAAEPAPAASEDDLSGSDSESEVDVSKHVEQLEKLKKADPEFFKYLEENDKDLLDFKGGADVELSEDEPDEDGDDDGSDSDGAEKSGKKGRTSITLTKPLVAKWVKEMEEKQSLRAMREVAVAFRAAANLNMDGKSEKVYRYSITNPEAYNALLLAALKEFPKALQHHVPVTESKSGKIRFDAESKTFRTLASTLKSHLGATQRLLDTLSDDASIRLTLDSLNQLVPYVLSFKKGIRDLIRSVVEVWSNPGYGEAVRISAFVVLQRIVLAGDAGSKDAVLKTTYQGLVKGSRNTTVYTIDGINLMKNSAAQLWGIDPAVGYTSGFTFIRQLAIHLRTSITSNSNESFKAVYNWQYIHSIDFWSRVVSAYCNSLAEAEKGQESPLRPLIYPIVQLTLGAIRLIPTAQYFPLRFQLVRSLIRISGSTGTYIPLGPALFEVANSAEMRRPAKPSTLAALDFDTHIRAPKAYLRTRVYQDGVGEQLAELLAESFVLWSTHVAFPELALPVVVMLKRWVREASQKATGNRNGKVNKAIGLALQKIEANAAFVERARAKLEFAPNSRAGVERFSKELEWKKTPLGAFVAAQRVVRDERRRLIEESRKERDFAREKRKGRGGDAEEVEDESESESDGDDEEEEEETEKEEKKTAAKAKKQPVKRASKKARRG